MFEGLKLEWQFKRVARILESPLDCIPLPLLFFLIRCVGKNAEKEALSDLKQYQIGFEEYKDYIINFAKGVLAAHVKLKLPIPGIYLIDNLPHVLYYLKMLMENESLKLLLVGPILPNGLSLKEHPLKQ